MKSLRVRDPAGTQAPELMAGYWDPDMSAGPGEHHGLSLQQIMAILQHYWKLAAMIVVGLTLLSAVVLKLMPKSYQATATLIVDENNKNPLAMQILSTGNVHSYVQTQMELLTSPVILLDVVDRMKLTQDRDFIAGYSGTGTQGLREYAVSNLAKALTVQVGRGGQLLFVTATAKSAERSAELANAVADTFLDVEARRVQGPARERAERYSRDLVELRRKVEAAQDKLRAFRRKNGLTAVTEGRGLELDNDTQQMNRLSDSLLEAQALRRSLEAKTAGQQATADETLASPIVQSLKAQRADLQSKLSQASTVYGPNHPKVVELKAQIAAVNRQIAGETNTLSGNIGTQLARARQLERKYEAAMGAQRSKVLALRDQQGEGAKLTLEIESAQAVYKRALEGYDQIMFASTSDGANTSIVSRAAPPVKAAKPNVKKLLAVAFLASVLAGVGGPFAYELFVRRRIRCRDDVERLLGVPVLAHFAQGSP